MIWRPTQTHIDTNHAVPDRLSIPNHCTVLLVLYKDVMLMTSKTNIKKVEDNFYLNIKTVTCKSNYIMETRIRK